ncbi:Dyp-type peroxidase [Streptomyces sp. NPDC089919]|uniref:Dyp-type peroxidase n=1 Tax=Streptomyces sp. NPDC089919 TaxID=3155188 RepID=UPI003436920E
MSTSAQSGPSRRGLLAGSALLVTGGSATGCGGRAGPERPGGSAAPGSAAPGAAAPGSGRGGPRHGPRQAGILTPAQRHALVLGYDLAPGVRGPDGARRLREVLAGWSRSAAGPAGETVTVGIGPALPARLGLRAPALLRELPGFPGDRLAAEFSGGDVLVQVCGEDRSGVAATAARVTAAAGTVLRPRWRQTGFLPAHAAGRTPRNLLGFKDGTANPTPAEGERWLWVPDGPDRDGSYLVMRRIRLRTERFAGLPVRRQEAVIGRVRDSGAPLGRRDEHTPLDLFAKSPEGRYVLPLDAHVRLAHSRLDGGARMLRRGYSYDDGPGDRGLLFLAYMNDPKLFVRVQERLAARDALRPFSEHVGSGLYFVLPGAAPGQPLGAALLA